MATFDCYKCSGTGQVAFKHIAGGVCFACGGSGRRSSPTNGATFVPVAPIIPEAERSTAKQWSYFGRLVKTDAEGRRLLKAAGAPSAMQLYVSRTVMRLAIDMAKSAA